MKFAYLAILPFLAGCSVSKAQWEPQVEKFQEEVDTTPPSILFKLEGKGYKDSILTGLRTELCEDDHALIGYGVILKKFDKENRPKAVGATVCLGWDNEITITEDVISGQ